MLSFLRRAEGKPYLKGEVAGFILFSSLFISVSLSG
ncbi:MAG: hypothetical protein ACJAYB_000628 [Psychromonas sp.]|jgi:hypothetical protein